MKKFLLILLLFTSCAIEGERCEPTHIFNVWQASEGFYWRTWIHLEILEREYTMWVSCSRDSVENETAAWVLHDTRDWGTYSLTKTCDTTWVKLKTKLINEINHD